MQQVSITLWKLNECWKTTEASKKWNVLIFDAIIKTDCYMAQRLHNSPKLTQDKYKCFESNDEGKYEDLNMHAGIDQQQTK